MRSDSATGQPDRTGEPPADSDRAFRTAVARLLTAGVDSPAAEARLLLAHAWSLSPSEVGRHILRGTLLPMAVAQRFDECLERRCRREPLQHITGCAAFRHLELAVGPGVFIPRPETELIVDEAQSWIASGRGRAAEPNAPVPAGPAALPDPAAASLRAADLCAGSGALGIALATELGGLSVSLVEKSPAAAASARTNADRYRAAARAVGSELEIVVADALSWEPQAQLDLIVANPPYVDRERQPDIPEVTRGDPEAALYGGGCLGLAFPIALLGHAVQLLRSGGLLIMEHAEYQSAELRAAMRAAGLSNVETRTDYTGRDRLTLGTRVGGCS